MAAEAEGEKFRLEEHGAISVEGVHVRPGNVLVDASNPNRLDHVRIILEEINPLKQDVVVVAVHRIGLISSSEFRLNPEQICGSREMETFTRVVSVAEKAGKHVELLTVTGTGRAVGVSLRPLSN